MLKRKGAPCSVQSCVTPTWTSEGKAFMKHLNSVDVTLSSQGRENERE